TESLLLSRWFTIRNCSRSQTPVQEFGNEVKNPRGARRNRTIVIRKVSQIDELGPCFRPVPKGIWFFLYLHFFRVFRVFRGFRKDSDYPNRESLLSGGGLPLCQGVLQVVDEVGILRILADRIQVGVGLDARG